MLKEFLEKLEQLVNISSWSMEPAGVTRVADVIEGWFTDLGWQVQRHNVGPEAGPLLQVTNKGTEKYDVVLLGHMDTVYPAESNPGWCFRTEGNIAYGPGVADMKNGLVSMYMAAKALNEDPEHAPAVCMLFNPDEEIGGRYSMKTMIEIVKNSPLLYVLEGSGTHGTTHCHERKGICGFNVIFHGQSAHAGNILDRPGASAILEAARWTEFICGLVDREKEITANVGIIEGGVAANVVPDYARIRAEVRTVTVEDMDAILAQFKEMEANPKTPGVTVEFQNLGGRPPLQPHEGTWKEIERAKAVAATLGQEFKVKKRGGVSDANNLGAAIPGLVCLDGMGTGGSKAHSPEEYMEIDTVEPCVKLLIALLKDLKK